MVEHLPGKGRHAGRLGAVVVELPNGLTFSVGTGFTDAQRQSPPPRGQYHHVPLPGTHRSRRPPLPVVRAGALGRRDAGSDLTSPAGRLKNAGSPRQVDLSPFQQHNSRSVHYEALFRVCRRQFRQVLGLW